MGELRITSGELRGRKVRAPAGEGTRPLLTRVRKSLADLLRPVLPGARVLDLFGGSGAVTLELLSNGAATAVAVELDPAAAELVRANALRLGVAERVEVVSGDALQAIPELARRGEVFGVVVVAPPYGLRLQQVCLDALATHPLLAPGGTVVVQRETREEPARATAPLVPARSRRYGRTVLDLYREPA